MSRASQRNAWLIQHCFSPYGTTQLEKTGKKGSFGPQKDPFGGSWCPRWAQGGQIWSQLHPIGPPGLDSWSPHTLTWYRALSTAQFLSGCIVYQPLLTCTIFIRAPANYRVVHLVIFLLKLLLQQNTVLSHIVKSNSHLVFFIIITHLWQSHGSLWIIPQDQPP